MTETVDVDALPPTQYLILEVLAARYRMGEHHWTFPDRCAPAARALEQAGLVWLRSGPAPHAFEARFTDAGRVACLSGEYVSPDVQRLQDELVAAKREAASLERLWRAEKARADGMEYRMSRETA